MNRDGALEGENAALRQRLARLSQASLRINESLDFDTVLQEVLNAARALTGGRYGVISLLGDAGQMQDFFFSGLTPEQYRDLVSLSDGPRLLEYLSMLSEPLRLGDFFSHTRALGFPDFRLPLPVSAAPAFLAAPIRHRGEGAGHIYLVEKEDGPEFTPEDEEILVMFASQAALVIANARRYREEQRARNRPGDPGQHLAGGGGGLRRPDRRAALAEPGGRADRQRPVRPGGVGGGPADGAHPAAGRRAGGLPGGAPPVPGLPRRGDGAGRGDRHAGARRAQRQRPC